MILNDDWINILLQSNRGFTYHSRSAECLTCCHRLAQSPDRILLRLRFRWPTPICLCPLACCFGSGPRSKFRWDTPIFHWGTCFRPIIRCTSCQLRWRRRCPGRVSCLPASCRRRYPCWDRWTFPRLIWLPHSTVRSTHSYRYRRVFRCRAWSYLWTNPYRHHHWSTCISPFQSSTKII